MRFEVQRIDYAGRPFDEASAAADPLEQFQAWFGDAQAAGLDMAKGLALATATATGAPSIRMVLLKDADPRGLVFYSNYESRKAAELAANPRAALLFYWHPLHRQVRVEGAVERVDATESEAYFATRPRGANLSAMASPQSRPVASRAALDELVDRLEAAWHGLELERPPHWGGYRLAPARWEFWQGREDRLHDRLEYNRAAGDGWTRTRLAP
jgi:pyridoxamine 5'-phosphate oxidase